MDAGDHGLVHAHIQCPGEQDVDQGRHDDERRREDADVPERQASAYRLTHPWDS